MDAEGRLAWPGDLGVLVGGASGAGGGPRLRHGDVDAAQLRAIHPIEHEQVAGLVDHRDVHRYAERTCLARRSRDDQTTALERQTRVISGDIHGFRHSAPRPRLYFPGGRVK